ncbi:hypothetical protein [Consotaella aegiceratis]|uniref:hypothetical protein n=1 Tax=Consotaella aegiceratis TaxID=3097961 RepID=UPI002F4130CE
MPRGIVEYRQDASPLAGHLNAVGRIVGVISAAMMIGQAMRDKYHNLHKFDIDIRFIFFYGAR